MLCKWCLTFTDRLRREYKLRRIYLFLQDAAFTKQNKQHFAKPVACSPRTGGKVFVLLGTKYSPSRTSSSFSRRKRSRFNFVGKGNSQVVKCFCLLFYWLSWQNFLREKKRFAFSTVVELPAGVKGLTNIRRRLWHCSVMDFAFKCGSFASASRGKAIKHKLSSRFRHQPECAKLSIGGTPADTRRTKHTESWGCTIKLNDLMLFPLL